MNKYLAFGEVIETDINFDDTLLKTDAKATFTITQTDFLANPRKLTKVHRQGVQARFGFVEKTAILVWDSIAKFRVSENKIEYNTLGADEKTLKLFVLSEAVGIALFLQGNFVLHGSCVLVDKRASIFIGEPGAGNSTTATAFWKAGKTILSDDLSVVKFINEKPFVLPAFPQLKVWKDALTGLQINTLGLEKSTEGGTKYLINQPFEQLDPQPIPLEKITVLLKHNSRKIEGPISVLETPTELLKHFPLPSGLLKAEYLKTHFLHSLKIAENVEITQLKRPKNFAALEEFVNSF
ncbi:MAG: serine kinase [Spirosomaceae bacterium]|nr:serine kinase [Spirosomataceae bacterium]